MIDFSKVKAMDIPEGDVSKITIGGAGLWNKAPATYRYVSFGDSIAAGHAINHEWSGAPYYGNKSQYGVNGNTSTAIVTNCYTDLINQELVARNPDRVVSVTSFARSGDTTADLIEKLSHDVVKSAIAEADLVTICIGANDVLTPALENFDDYVINGQQALDKIASTVEKNLAVLNDEASPLSYTALFNKLAEINPNAQYIFTTIYNPYKYLHLDEGTDGFFSELLKGIPQVTILWYEVDEAIKKGILDTDAIQTLFDRVNNITPWAEKYVNQLNDVLKAKIAAYQNPNFKVAETKVLFDTYPDRSDPANVHYNDLVNVEYTSGYKVSDMDWGRLWADSSKERFWFKLANDNFSLSSGLNIEGVANDLVEQIIEKVIIPDIDPHPEASGHKVLKQSFINSISI